MEQVGVNSDLAAIRLDQEFLATNDLNRVEQLILAGARINTVNETGHTKLHLAIQNKQYAILGLLIAAGADASIRSVNNYAPLAIALKNKDERAVWMLATLGFDLDQSHNGIGAQFTFLANQLLKLNNKGFDPLTILQEASRMFFLEAPDLMKVFPVFPKPPDALITVRDLEVLHIFVMAGALLSSVDPDHYTSDSFTFRPKEAYPHISRLLKNIFSVAVEDISKVSQGLLNFEQADLKHFKDFYQFALKYLVVPEILNQIPAGYLSEFNKHIFHKVEQDIGKSFLEYLTMHRPIDLLQNLNQIWHLRVNDFIALARDFSPVGDSWRPVLPNCEIPTGLPELAGWKIINLVNGEQLSHEGQALRHCVAGYSRSCMEHNSHICSIRDPSNVSRSTFEFKVLLADDANYKDRVASFRNVGFAIPETGSEPARIFRLVQHSGERNASPSEECKKIIEYFMDQVKFGIYDLKPQTIVNEQGVVDFTQISFLENYVGIRKDRFNAERCEQVIDLFAGRSHGFVKLRHGRKKSLIPRALSRQGYDAFFEASGLRTAIKGSLAIHFMK